jgi:ATP-dependent exoDNAse (exonuclease V) alpha subunit
MQILPHKDFSVYKINVSLNKKYKYKAYSKIQADRLTKLLCVIEDVNDSSLSLKEYILAHEYMKIKVKKSIIKAYENKLKIQELPHTLIPIGYCDSYDNMQILNEQFNYHITDDENYIYLNSDLDTENAFVALHTRTTSFIIPNSISSELTDEQKNVAKNIIASTKFMNYIIGGAGCGKTKTVSTIIKHIKYMCIAPTHRAKTELRGNGLNATTIHAAYYSQPTTKDKFDVLVVDEVSMGSIQHVKMLLTIIKKYDTKKVIMLGDDKQLPPIARGSLFQLIDNYPKERLTYNFRARNNRYLAMYSKWLGDEIIKESPISFATMKKVISSFKHDSIKLEDVLSFIDNNIDDIISNDAKILSFVNDDVVGINKYIITKKLKQSYNMPFHGELRIVTCNDKFKNFQTGDYVNVRMKDRVIMLNNEPTTLTDYQQGTDSGYAVTVHKSQSATYKSVCFYNSYINRNINLNLIYTAITRAALNLSIHPTETYDDKKIFKMEDRDLVYHHH